MKTWTRLLVVGVVSAIGVGNALAQNGQPNPQQQLQQQQQQQQQAAPQQNVQQNTTVTTGQQTQVTERVVEGNVGLSHIGIRLGQRFDCNHVINMLVRKQHQQQFGGGIFKPAPMIHFGPYGEQIVQPELGDLELVSVCLANPGDVDHAPSYAITIANHGKVDICHFKVSAVAVLCEIHEFAPTTTIKVEKICPGEAVTVEVQLPFASMAMENCGHRKPFDTLVVAIDAFDQIMECNELNNILILKRTAITVVEETQSTVEETTTTETPLPNDNAQVAPAPSAPAPDGGVQQPKASPLDNIDLDNLDLSGESEATGLLSFEGSPF